MGFREDALSAAAAQHERELREQEAEQESLRREAMTKLHKPALKALKDWSKRTGVSTANLTVEPVLLPGYPRRYELLLTWSSDGCEFSARYRPPRGTSTPPTLQVMMQDPSNPTATSGTTLAARSRSARFSPAQPGRRGRGFRMQTIGDELLESVSGYRS